MQRKNELIDVSALTGAIVPQKVVNELIEFNDQSAYYNLSLSAKDVRELVQERNIALKSVDRIEFGFNTLKFIIETFYKSPYINQFEYVEILNEIQTIFYHYRNEVDDVFSDEELIILIEQLFDGAFNGSLELLRGKGMEFILQAADERRKEISDEVRNGKL